MTRCLNCMLEYEEEYEICPYCGYVRGTRPQEPYHLFPGMELAGKYTVGTVIGFGGFGVIYKAWDKNLDKIVAIKEYYPTTYLSRIAGEKTVNVYDKRHEADFEKGKRAFLEEARNLAKFNNHPNIVHVYDFFEENGTAYFVMEYLDGCNLKTFLQINEQKGKRISVDTALQITHCVLNALKSVHASKIIHRDIKPGNIFICKDNTIKLIDLGAARFADSEMEKTRTIIITPGYAPAEQYQIKSKQGPYTDIYAVAAVLYEMLTGIKPNESINRKIEDDLVEPQKINSEIPINVNNAVMRAMAIQPEIRFQNVDQFAKALKSERKVRDAKREIRYRKFRRGVRIAALTMLIIAVGVFCFLQYRNIRKEAILDPAELSLWVPYGEEGQQAAEELMNEMIAEFLQNNEMIQIEVNAIDQENYEEELRAALANGVAPDVFDSSCLNSGDYSYMAELSKLFDFELFDVNQYYFLEQYSTYYPSAKQLPLTVDVPIIYQNTILDIDKNIDMESSIGNSYEDFANQEVKYYLGNIDDYSKVQSDLSGVYALNYPDATESVAGEFCNLWSINVESTKEEYAAAIRLMYYLLSETAQDYLTVQNDNHLPLNKNILQVYMEVNNDFIGIEDYLKKISIIGE